MGKRAAKLAPRNALPGQGNACVHYRRAGLLDIPLIFELLQDGAESGSFGDKFVSRMGSMEILRLILQGLWQSAFGRRDAPLRSEWLVICLPSHEAAGFLKLTTNHLDHGNRTLEMLAIHPALRNRGIGTRVLRDTVASTPSGTQLHVHCTKYARAMQHILKSNGLKRNVRFNMPRLEEYRTDFAAFGK